MSLRLIQEFSAGVSPVGCRDWILGMHFAKALKLTATTATIGSTAPVSRNPVRGWRPVVKGDSVAAIQKSAV